VRNLGFILAALLLAGCTGAATTATVTGPAPPPPPAPVPFDQAVLNAGNAVFTAAAVPGTQKTVVIDPLVNGVTGEQSASTKALGARLADLAQSHYPQLKVLPFNARTVASADLVMVGTFTPVNAQNQPTGAREAYRFCLVMADLKVGKTVAKSVARARPEGVDTSPTRVFADSPAWTEDPSIKGYIATCQATKVGDPIPPIYLNGIVTAATLNQAMEAYDAGRYQDALQLYEAARATPTGDQSRTYNGLYLSRMKLRQRGPAEAAFGDVVDYGFRNNRLGVKLLFRPASTAFAPEGNEAGVYDMWLRRIADRGARAGACLQVTGHTSASGSPPLNQRLSVLRAEYVKTLLEQDAAALRNRVIAAGAGSDQPLVGTGADNTTDMLDRRVEFKIIPSC
jgi:outer membrane protein OmpA-like peptidoglycan-associated protein